MASRKDYAFAGEKIPAMENGVRISLDEAKQRFLAKGIEPTLVQLSRDGQFYIASVEVGL